METGQVGSFGQHCWSRVRFYRLLLLLLALDSKGHCGGHELGVSGLGLRNAVLHILVPCASTALLSWADTRS